MPPDITSVIRSAALDSFAAKLMLVVIFVVTGEEEFDKATLLEVTVGSDKLPVAVRLDVVVRLS